MTSEEAAMAESSTVSPPPGATNRERAIEALMTLLEEEPFERIGTGDVARVANLSLAELRAEFPSVLAIVAAHMKGIDRKVLAADFSDMADEPVRERLFEILMRRLDLLTPHKAAIRSLMRSALRNPPLALAMNGLAARSMGWMMEAAGISTAGPRGVVRAQALALFYARALSAWLRDDDPGLARTMAALDRELARGQQWSGLLDRLLAIPDRLHSVRRRARRRRDPDPNDDVVAA
jgi:AcrR family transcriptional regulator